MRANFAKFTPRRFRILIIGRANSGKTTILRRLCNATEEPTILSPNGEKVHYIVKFHTRYLTSMSIISDRVIGPYTIPGRKWFVNCRLYSINILTTQRGEQDIENQIIYESKPDFVFHDSRGFEAGSDQEMKLVQEFINKRSSSENVDERLHAIWCVTAHI